MDAAELCLLHEGPGHAVALRVRFGDGGAATHQDARRVLGTPLAEHLDDAVAHRRIQQRTAQQRRRVRDPGLAASLVNGFRDVDPHVPAGREHQRHDDGIRFALRFDAFQGLGHGLGDARFRQFDETHRQFRVRQFRLDAFRERTAHGHALRVAGAVRGDDERHVGQLLEHQQFPP